LEGFHAILTELLSHEKIAELPVTETTRPAPPPASRKQEGKFRVLLADDSQITRDLYRILLQRNGYQVELAKDGAEALLMLRSSSFDAVITDDQMPAMDGSEFLRAAKNDERLYHVPFILMSGHATDEARSKAMKFGAAAYLVKGGFEKEQLLVILKEAIEKAQG
ncbi:MAG TPA: response regulator, partial [Bacteroidota bacterium]|nr:response regulator [Bacteroidota bacterium]